MAQLIVRRFGTTVTIRRTTTSAYDPSTGTAPTSVTDHTGKGRFDEYRDRELSDVIHAGDRKLILAAADWDFTPSVDDEVLIGGVAHDIVRVQTELATDLAALYILQLRR